MRKFIILSVIVPAALAAGFAPLFARQTTSLPCSQQPGLKPCGSDVVCIAESWTCCPDGSGGCPPTKYCSLGDNGKYGCCLNGETCAGPGGATTLGSTGTQTITDTTSQPAQPTATSTSTVPVPLTSSESPKTSTPSPTLSVATTSSTASPSSPLTSSSLVGSGTIASTGPLPLFTGGAATNQLPFSQISIFGSLLVLLLPGLLN